jgi:predicted metal-dependent HD superfamily phosphohydrolase
MKIHEIRSLCEVKLKATECIRAINQEYEYVAEVIILFDGMNEILRDMLQQSPFKTSSNGMQ